ncbi:MAG: glycosyltransferase [Bacteroidales bacterium]|nr:glycosyltransferase [Bacteroidales bacterium]
MVKTMELSVIIVNYNVKHFLQQCLASVYEAGMGINMEVWVVDNGSVDGSAEMVRQQFPQVRLIVNKDNPGFAKANNQALKKAKGDYLLLLNPDTLVERATFRKCLDFMHEHTDCGGLTVKMLDGKGKYLKESKRGFPSPETSFYKISGLIRLFPHNKRIAAYYLGHLNEDEVNEIEVLPGAYMLISQAAYEKVGGLDETFFMYGEDIDYSWRIKLAGYKNYYLPSARIIHYKGESTKKGSLNYVYTFYNAMAIFANKYFSGSRARVYNELINLAIWFRASLSFIVRMVRAVTVPLMDFLFAFAGFAVIKQIWAIGNYNINYYPLTYTWLILPLYVVVLMLGGWLAGGYDKPIKIGHMARGMSMGALALLVFYSLVSESMRYSRAILLLGTAWSIAVVILLRVLYSAMNIPGYALRAKHRNVLIVGSGNEVTRIEKLLHDMGFAPNFVAKVTTDEGCGCPSNSIGHLKELIHYHRIDEIIFCSRDIAIQDIISRMDTLKATGVDYKIVPSESDFIIGSDTISSSESLLAMDLKTIATDMNRRNKRLFDITMAVLLLLLSPILFWFQEQKGNYFRHVFQVFMGKKSWVGYAIPDTDTDSLPQIKEGVLSPADLMLRSRGINAHRINLRYAKNYKLSTDLAVVIRNINRI